MISTCARYNIKEFFPPAFLTCKNNTAVGARQKKRIIDKFYVCGKPYRSEILMFWKIER